MLVCLYIVGGCRDLLMVSCCCASTMLGNIVYDCNIVVVCIVVVVDVTCLRLDVVV